MRIQNFTAPSAWASYLINHDATSLGGAEIAQAEIWLADIGMGSPVDAEDAGFCWHHDAFETCPYGADCQSYTFLAQEAAA